jgi:peptidoglycan-N-acetylglucosamine deacetylase
VHKIVLTFDDGPALDHTPRILDTLAEFQVPALFFVVGERLQAPGAREIVRRAAREGHLIGNHSFSHPNLTEVSPEEIHSQIKRTHDLISDFEPRRRLFRPPYGACNDTVRAIAKELGYKVVLWSASSDDWKAENSSAWVDIALAQISGQHLAICLCHDRAHTADHLFQFIERVRLLASHQFVSYEGRRDLRWLVDGLRRRTSGWTERIESRFELPK